MTLSDLSVKKPVFAWMLMAAILVFGTISFIRIGVSQFPDVDYPMITVNITREGSAPEIMETEVIDTVEDAVMSVEGVQKVSSSAHHGRATITVEFELSRDIDAALQDVQAKVSQAQRLLPKDIDPPVFSKTNPEDQPIMWIGLSGYRSPQELSDLVRFKLRDQLKTAHPGIAEVMLGGFLERNVRVWMDAQKLESHQLTVDDVIQAIQREHVEVPAGRIEGSHRELNVRFKGEAPTVDLFRQTVVAEMNGSQITLGDVAVVEDGLEDFRRMARSMGIPSQGMGVKKMRGANAVAVAEAVRAKVEELQKTLPSDLQLFVSFDASKFIEEAIDEIKVAMLLSILLTALVCWLFLGSISSTINVVMAIPVSLAGTFAVMYFSGFTMNLISVLALSLAVGIVVDDAIMVLENIHRHAEGGRSRVEAALVGAREITFAAMAATLAIVAIFLPVAFMKGLVGKFFFQFGVVLSVTVLFSYLEAVTLTPARCSQMLSVGERRSRFGRAVDRFFLGLSSLYARILPFCLRRRYAVIAAAGLIFVASLFIISLLGKENIPAQDQSRFMVRLYAPIGSSIHTTDKLTRQAEEFLMGRPEVKRYFCAVGGFGGGDVDTAIMFVTLVPPGERKLSQEQMIALVRKEFNSIPDLRAVPLDLSKQDPSGRRSYPVELIVKGPDWNVLAGATQKIMEQMKASRTYVDVDSNYRVGMPEVRILPDSRRAADAQVSMAGLGNTIGSLIGGVRVAKFEDQGRRYDVRVRLTRSQRLRPEDIRPLMVRARTGDLVPLTDLVQIKEQPSLQSITREQRERAITITANLPPGISQGDALEEVQAIARGVLSQGYHSELSGGAETFKETFQGLIFAMALGLAIAYMILASQFNSFIHPFTVLGALPFSVTGALIALWLGGFTLNMFSMLGILLLMGIVKKNSIILVDYTNQRRAQGLPHEEALIQACPIRLRPILMTTLSTIAGAIPPALALGPGGELRTPMALAIIGGIILSTLLTLFVVPAVYATFEDIKRKLGMSGPPVPAEQKSVHISSA